MQKIERENRTTRKTKENKNQNNLTGQHWAWLNSVFSASASDFFAISQALNIIHTQLIQKKEGCEDWIASERRIFFREKWRPEIRLRRRAKEWIA